MGRGVRTSTQVGGHPHRHAVAHSIGRLEPLGMTSAREDGIRDSGLRRQSRLY